MSNQAEPSRADLLKHIKELTEAVTASNALVQQIANQIELKIDHLCNGEVSQKAPQQKPKPKKNFFKEMIKSDINTYLDELYTQDELDQIQALDDVKSKKKEDLRLGKVADLLFEEIKHDAARLKRLDDIYEEYKQGLNSE